MYFFELVIIDDIPITSEDWVGAFNGDICVGSRQWDTALCANGVCEVTVMGSDGTEHSEGYMWPGDIPSFKIYVASENMYYDAIPSESFPWFINDFNITYSLSAYSIVSGCTDPYACNYDPEAEVDDGSCEYLDCNFDCFCLNNPTCCEDIPEDCDPYSSACEDTTCNCDGYCLGEAIQDD